jgi:Rod binding domain-containing protein
MELSRATFRNAEHSQPTSPKLVKATQDFESILLTNWLEKVQQSFAGGEDSGDAGHDTLSALGTQAMASALAARGGIGIARMLLQRLGEQGGSKGGESPATPAIPRENESAKDSPGSSRS